MDLTSAGYGRLVDACSAIASGSGRARMVVVLEGGYDLDALAEASATVVGRLLGRPGPPVAGAPGPGAERLVEVYRRAQKPFWPAL
jgi:acetoin utilization deacetylase AcuC-like enzyme